MVRQGLNLWMNDLELFERSSFHVDDRFQSYSVSPDGRRFLMIELGADSAPRQLNVILNWF